MDGAPRVAKTGTEIGSPIYFNRKLLYHKDENGQPESLDFASATGILIHELGHHQGVMDHQKLDLLAAKVRHLLLSEAEIVRLRFPLITLTTLNFSDTHMVKEGLFSQLLLSSGDHTEDLTAKLLEAIKCPLSEERPQGVYLTNLHLSRRRLSADASERSLFVRGFIQLECPEIKGFSKYDPSYRKVDGYELEMRFDSKHGSLTSYDYEYIPDSADLQLDQSRALQISGQVRFRDQMKQYWRLIQQGGRFVTDLSDWNPEQEIHLETIAENQGNGGVKIYVTLHFRDRTTGMPWQSSRTRIIVMTKKDRSSRVSLPLGLENVQVLITSGPLQEH